MKISKKLLTAISILMLGVSTSAYSKIMQVKGSDTILGVTQSMAENYMMSNKKARIAVVGGGSGIGISSLINGTTDIAMASRNVKESEFKAATAKGLTIKEVVLGHDGINIVVNHGNKVKNISSVDLAKVYRGEITNWKDLGGADAAIVVLSRDSSSGTHEFFKEHVVREGKSKGKQEFGKATLFLPSNEAIKQEIVQNVNAIGYIGMGFVDKEVASLSLNNIEPTFENVLSKKYTLSREIYWVTSIEPSEEAKAFIDYALSPEGQAIVKEEGFISIK